MKEIKRRMETFLLYDKAGMVRQLEKMAADGWMLDKITTFFWQYKRIEPAQLHFEVTYLPKVSGFDSAPTLAQREYWDYCHYAGWELAASSAQMQIFYSTEDDPMPIETEPLVQLDNIRKTMKLQMIMFGIILFTFVMQVGLRLSMVLNYPIDELTDNMTFVILLLLLIAGLILAVDMVMYFVWLRKAKRMAVEENEFYETTSMTGVRKAFCFLSYSLLQLACVLSAVQNLQQR